LCPPFDADAAGAPHQNEETERALDGMSVMQETLDVMPVAQKGLMKH